MALSKTTLVMLTQSFAFITILSIILYYKTIMENGSKYRAINQVLKYMLMLIAFYIIVELPSFMLSLHF